MIDADRMRRILVIGSPGAGKSTLADELGRHLGLPVIHLDRHYWRPGWIEPDPGAWQVEAGALCAAPAWVMDGNYGGTLPVRLQRADTVIWLDFPPWRCVWRILARWRRWRGRVRPDMREGCPEQMSWEFLSYTARFPWNGRRRLESALLGWPGTPIRLRTPGQVRACLAGLEEGGSR